MDVYVCTLSVSKLPPGPCATLFPHSLATLAPPLCSCLKLPVCLGVASLSPVPPAFCRAERDFLALSVL